MSEYDQQNFNASVICWSSHLQTLRCVPVNDHMLCFERLVFLFASSRLMLTTEGKAFICFMASCSWRRRTSL